MQIDRVTPQRAAGIRIAVRVVEAVPELISVIINEDNQRERESKGRIIGTNLEKVDFVVVSSYIAFKRGETSPVRHAFDATDNTTSNAN